MYYNLITLHYTLKTIYYRYEIRHGVVLNVLCMLINVLVYLGHGIFTRIQIQQIIITFVSCQLVSVVQNSL
jgi:hypothetical protein